MIKSRTGRLKFAAESSSPSESPSSFLLTTRSSRIHVKASSNSCLTLTDFPTSKPNLGIKCTGRSMSFTLITAYFLLRSNKYILLEVLLAFRLVSNHATDARCSGGGLVLIEGLGSSLMEVVVMLSLLLIVVRNCSLLQHENTQSHALQPQLLSKLLQGPQCFTMPRKIQNNCSLF